MYPPIRLRSVDHRRKTLHGSSDHLLVVIVLLVQLLDVLISISVGQLPLKRIGQLSSRLVTHEFCENRLLALLQGKVFIAIILLESLLALLTFFKVDFSKADDEVVHVSLSRSV